MDRSKYFLLPLSGQEEAIPMAKKAKKGGVSREEKRRRKASEMSEKAKAATATAKNGAMPVPQGASGSCKPVMKPVINLSAVCAPARGAPPALKKHTIAKETPKHDLAAHGQLPAADAGAPGAPVLQQVKKVIDDANDPNLSKAGTTHKRPTPAIVETEAHATAPPVDDGAKSSTTSAALADSGPERVNSAAVVQAFQMDAEHHKTDCIAPADCGQETGGAAAAASADLAVPDMVAPADCGHLLPPADCGRLLPPADCGRLLPPADLGHLLPPADCGHLFALADCGHLFPSADCGHVVAPADSGHVLAPAASGPDMGVVAAAAPEDQAAAHPIAPTGSGLELGNDAAAAPEDQAVTELIAAVGSGLELSDDAAAAPADQAATHPIAPAASGLELGYDAAAAPADQAAAPPIAPAGSGLELGDDAAAAPEGQAVTAAASAPPADDTTSSAAPAGNGPDGDAAAALPPPPSVPVPCGGPGRLTSAVCDTVASASAALAQARQAYWGLGCLVGAPLHLAGALHYVVPGAFIDGVMLAGRGAHLACYAAREVVALPTDSLRVWRAHWART